MNTIINYAKTIPIIVAILIVNVIRWTPFIAITAIVTTQPINGREILLIGIPVELLIGSMCIIHARNITKGR
jgi:hypothetical protein